MLAATEGDMAWRAWFCVVAVGCSTVPPRSATDSGADTAPAQDSVTDSATAPDSAPDSASDVPTVPELPACMAVNCPFKPCQAAKCDADEACVYVKLPSGTPCDDGDACTLEDKCAAGTCAAGGLASCDDDNTCTTDTCIGLTGCQHTAAIGKACNDHNACSAGDFCDAVGACFGPTQVVCNSGNPCAIGSCSPTKGCMFSAVTVSTPCNPNDPCQAAVGICVGTTCKGQPITAPSSGPCFLDLCTTVNGKAVITSVVQPSQPCDDSDGCTEGDVCDPAGNCAGTSLACPNGKVCDPTLCGGVPQTCGQCPP